MVSFHFHGYQPGDIVRWIEPDPLKPPRFEERVSPVAVKIGGESVRGRNWTDAVLRSYGRIERVLEIAAGAASVDVEPQTLAWLLEKDPGAYRRVLAAWEKGVAGFAITPPFHPILPHHNTAERLALFDMMIDFFAPISRRVPETSIGFWLPETAFSREVARDYVAAVRRSGEAEEGRLHTPKGVHLLVDDRQLAHRAPGLSWSRTVVDGAMPVAARDPGLSGDFAFGGSPPEQFATAVRGRGASVLVASDLESLLANPAQADRFEGIVSRLRAEGSTVTPPTPSDAAAPASLIDFSSWSDYEEHLHEGHTSDTRWTGIRRSDGRIVHRTHRGAKVSQLWKHAFGQTSERIETAVRRTARDLLGIFDSSRRGDIVRRLSVAYGRHLFQQHYRANGASRGDVDFGAAADRIVAGKVDAEVLAYMARAYTMMLMGLRSDPRFWDNMDTRVTFQNVVCLTQALVDASEALRRSGRQDASERVRKLLRATLLEFADTYSRANLSHLQGVEGWETSKEAWLASIQSEVSSRSRLDVVRRATLFALKDGGADASVGRDGVRADTGHIVGEAHGEWDDPTACEHRP